LVEKGADTKLKDAEEMTAHELAKQEGHSDIAKYLEV